MPGKRILVVDDDKKITSGIGTFLKTLGYEMLLAVDGEEAMRFIKGQEPNLVLLDIQMPGVNGMEVLRILRRDFKGIKVFVVTGYSKDVKEGCDKIGFDRFFEKPVELDPLLEAIRDALGIKKVIAEEKPEVSGVTPRAKLLFIEPDIHTYAYLCSMLSNREMCGGEYTTKVMKNTEGVLDVLIDFYPDIVLIGDSSMSEEQILTLADLILANIKIKPKSIIVHGIFEHAGDFEARLRRKGVRRCIQNVMDNEMLMKMNRKLSDCVADICVKQELVRDL